MTWSDVVAFVWDELTRARFSVLFLIAQIVGSSLLFVILEGRRDRREGGRS